MGPLADVNDNPALDVTKRRFAMTSEECRNRFGQIGFDEAIGIDERQRQSIC